MKYEIGGMKYEFVGSCRILLKIHTQNPKLTEGAYFLQS
jgi:hypothetical protein